MIMRPVLKPCISSCINRKNKQRVWNRIAGDRNQQSKLIHFYPWAKVHLVCLKQSCCIWHKNKHIQVLPSESNHACRKDGGLALPHIILGLALQSELPAGLILQVPAFPPHPQSPPCNKIHSTGEKSFRACKQFCSSASPISYKLGQLRGSIETV